MRIAIVLLASALMVVELPTEAAGQVKLGVGPEGRVAALHRGGQGGERHAASR